MSLGDALYSMVISGGRVYKLKRTDFTGDSWEASSNSNKVATLSNMLYVSRIDVITDKDTSSTNYFLEGYSNIESADTSTEETFLWSFPIDGSNAKNQFTFLQPIQLNTKIDLVIRSTDPYPTGTVVNMGSDTDNWLIMVEGYPRNIT